MSAQERLAYALTAIALVSCWQTVASAEIITDGTLAGAREVISGTVDTSHALVVDNVAYYSFEQITTRTDQDLAFELPSNVESIIVRLTGGTGTTINRAIIVGPELTGFYLFDPAGISIGDGVELANLGTLVLATPDRVELSDAVTIPMTPATFDPAGGLPTNYFFDNDNGTLEIKGAQLTVTDSLLLFGGTVDFNRGTDLSVATGQLAIGAAAAGSEVSVNHVHWELTGPMGRVVLSDAPQIEMDGADFVMYGDSLELTSATISQTSDGADDTISLAGNVIGLVQTSICATTGVGPRSTLTLEGNQISLQNDSEVCIEGASGGGSINIQATNSLLIDNSQVNLGAIEALDTGIIVVSGAESTLASARLVTRVSVPGGEPAIQVSGDAVTARSGSQIIAISESLTAGSDISVIGSDEVEVPLSESPFTIASLNSVGPAGEVTVESPGYLAFGDTNFLASGDTPGLIRFNVDDVTVDGGEILSVSGAIPPASAIAGAAPIEFRVDEMSITNGRIGVDSQLGDAGRVTITAGGPLLLDNGAIHSSAREDAGNSGGIEITAASLSAGLSEFVSLSPMNAGGISLQSTTFLDLSNSSRVHVSAGGDAEGGIRGLAGNVIGITGSSVLVQADGVFGEQGVFLNASQIHLEATNITVEQAFEAPADVELAADVVRMVETTLSTCADNPDGSGDILLTAPDTVALEGQALTRLESCNTGSGDAGDIAMETPLLFVDLPPNLDASAESGDAGAISTGDDMTQLVNSTALPPGDDCPSGGTTLSIGRDDGLPAGTANDAVLDESEIDQQIITCFDEEDALSRTRTEQSGENCESGGIRVESGLDAQPTNGLLDDDEVESTRYLCSEDVPSSDPDGDASQDVADPDGSGAAELLEDQTDADSPSEDASCGCSSSATPTTAPVVLTLLIVSLLRRRQRIS